MSMDTLLTRRSIRKFKSMPVPPQLLHQVLRAGTAAPSAGDEQPWHFIVIDDRKLLEAVTQFHPHAAMLKESPLAILACADTNLEKHKGFWVQDLSAATENMLIAVNELGLGSVWLGVYPREDRMKGFRDLFSLPENIVPFSLLPVGYADEKKAPADRFRRDRIHQNKW